jgi:hypothetical protein
MRRQFHLRYPLNKRVGRPQSRVDFWRCINNVVAVRIIFSTLGLAAIGIVLLQTGLRIIVCGWITNMSNVCCMPTVFVTNYDCVLTVATKPVDQYFCWVLGVESRFSQVVDVIDQQSVRSGAAT